MNIPWEKIEPKLGKWASNFLPFYEGGGFDAIYAELKKQGQNVKILPEGKDLFKAFELCPKEKLCTIWLGQDPYPTIKYGKVVADGLAFSCGYTKEEQPSLKLIYDAMEEDLFDGMNLSMLREPSLEYLAKQGVLLLNSSLTTPEGKPGTHKELWRPFMTFFFKEVMAGISGIPIVLFGKQAEEYEELVDLKMNYTKTVEHPAAASYQQRPFRHNKLFKWTNTILKDNNNLEIDWLNLPF